MKVKENDIWNVQVIKGDLSRALQRKMKTVDISQTECLREGVVDINRGDFNAILKERFKGQSLAKMIKLANDLGIVVKMDFLDPRQVSVDGMDVVPLD